MANEWDRTPWMIGGNAIHSVNVGRLLAYAAFEGDEGIIGVGDLQVKAAAAPNGTVRVMPGACGIINRGLNINYEAYAARLPIADTVSIGATGSGAGRSDLVVAIVMNPYQDGEPWPDPPIADVNAATAEFVKTMVIPNVAPGTRTVKSLNLGYSAIALARIDIPANTATITQAMIVDLRQMCSVRQKIVTRSNHVTTLVGGTLPSAWARWPSEASAVVDIPEWANYAFMKGQVTSVYRAAGNTISEYTVRLVRNGVPLENNPTHINVSQPSEERANLILSGGSVLIPASWRGEQATLEIIGHNLTPGLLISAESWHCAFDFQVTITQAPGSSE